MRTLAVVVAATVACLLLASPALAKLKVKYMLVDGTASPDSVEELNVFCPDGYKVTGGGASGMGGYELNKILDSYPIDGNDSGARPDDGWRATIWSTSAGPVAVEAQAICAKNVKVKNKRRLISPGSSEEPPTCSKGYSATGGGIDTAGTFATPVNVVASHPTDGPDQNHKAEYWFARAETGTHPVTATAHVMCAKTDDAKLRYVSETLNVSAEDQGSGEVLCEEDEVVLGVGGATNASGTALVTMFGADGNDSDTTPDDGATITVDNFNPLEILPGAHAVCAKEPK